MEFDDPVLNRFAASIGMSATPLRSLNENSASDQLVIIDLDLLTKLKSGGDQSLDQCLLNFDRLLGVALRIARQHKRTLSLRSGFDFEFECSPFARFKWWRRPRKLIDWLDSGEVI